MSWFRLMNNFAGHRKVKRLALYLGCSRVEARGYLITLFCNVSQESPDGNLSDWLLGEVAEAADFEGDPKKLYDALYDAGWLTSGDNGDEINDWMEYAEGYVKAENARKAREGKKSKKKGENREYSQNTASPLENGLQSSRKQFVDAERRERRGEEIEDMRGEERSARRGEEKVVSASPPKKKLSKAQEEKRKSEHPKNAEAKIVAEYYRQSFPGSGTALKPGNEVFGNIRQRLVSGYSVEDLKDAVDGIKLDKWHVENNNTSPQYVFRNSEKVDKFIKLKRNPAQKQYSGWMKETAEFAQAGTTSGVAEFLTPEIVTQKAVGGKK